MFRGSLHTLLATAFALALIALATSCGSSEAELEPGEVDTPGVAERELEGISGWLNSEPFTITEQLAEQNVVLIDFWTYTCVNCIRTLPFLREWHDKYAEHGLVILGVHSPEFEFEHDAENVAAAMEQLGVTWAVAQDNDFETWRAFDNSYWPAKYLFGVDGEIRYRHFGEGDYLETEEAIREALTRAGHDVEGIPLGSTPPERDPEAGAQTRELYGGYERGYHSRGLYAAQDLYYTGPDMELEYEDIDTSRIQRNHNQWYLQGLWRNESESIVHARTTENLEDYIALRFVARSVNVVLNPPPGEPFEVVIELDGRPLLPEEAGADVVFDDEGRSIIVVDEPRLFALVELPVWSEHELKLRSNSDAFAIFAFTFGNYLEGA